MEIIFRGKRVNNGEWIYGWYCMYSFGQWPLKDAIVQLEKAHNGCFEPIEVENTTVGQYTGLKDKNGKRIFECDIIKFDIPKGEWGDIAVIIFESGEFRYKPITNAKKAWNCRLCKEEKTLEVIGNIHENPELLEVTT